MIKTPMFQTMAVLPTTRRPAAWGDCIAWDWIRFDDYIELTRSFGKTVSFSREAIINDDLGVFSYYPRSFMIADS